MNSKPLSRRHFIQSAGGTLLGALALPSVALYSRWSQAVEGAEILSADPISRVVLGQERSVDFNGDLPDFPHALFWDKWNTLNQLGGVPAPSEEVPLLIVGGGVAGLLSAWGLRDQRPVVLEQAKSLGGNAKGEQWGDLTYSVGSAYLSEPAPGDDVDLLLRELEIRNEFRAESYSTSRVLLKGQLTADLWSQAPRVLLRLLELGQKKDLRVERWKQWDALSFEQWLASEFGELPIAIHEYVTLYCWSSFGMDLSEVSAAQALDFLTSDLQGVIAAPGGNAVIARALSQKLRQSGTQFRIDSLIADIQVRDDGVHICVMSSDRKLRTIRAQRCIVAAPKYMARMMIDDLPRAQSEAMGRMGYRAYLVANVLLNERVHSPSYELFRLQGRKTKNPQEESRDRPFTDLCFAGWAESDSPTRSALTIYKAMPFEGARHFLFSNFAHEKYKAQVESGLPEVLAELGLGRASIAGIRMTRWGHAIPAATRGFHSEGHSELVSASFRGKVFFANQDNSASPSFESSFAAARSAVAELKRS